MHSEAGLMVGTRQTAILLVFLLGFAAQSPAASTALIGWSETGLHETDGADVSVYSMAPPYSTIHAQLINAGLLVTNPNGFTVTYQAIADATGSINTTSQGKGNFYQYAEQLFGTNLAPDQGLGGFAMPGPANQPQPMRFDPAQNCFTAEGIPVTPYDDQGRKNYFPMMRLVVRDSTSTVLATADIAVPVSDEMDCRACHASGSQVAARPPSGWAWNVDPIRDYKLNVLRAHDDHLLGGTVYSNVLALVGYDERGLVATVVQDGQPVSCVRCHSSGALPGTGAPGMRPLTQLMHTKHSYVSDPVSGAYLISATNSATCLLCHAGPEKLLQRGVHHNSINTNGALAMQCQSCHGSIGVVGTTGRQGWVDEPLCQSCHTGTALTNSGALRFTSVFDSAGAVRQPADTTFATQASVPAAGLALFHSSQGHGGMNCSACHGPAHGEWLSSQPNDNVQSAALKTPAGAGVLVECTACHLNTFTNRTGGPHGMHPVDSLWAASHDQGNRTQCQTCHGADPNQVNQYRGTVLSWTQGSRNYNGDTPVSFWQGFQVSCYACHLGPNGTDSGLANPFPTVSSLSASTTAGVPVPITLVGSAFNGGSVSFRVASQPAHGTVSLSGNVATFFPEPTFLGNDSFTYTAWDGSANSPLGTVALTTTAGSCLLSASALVPMAAFPNSAVPFRALVNLSQCAGPITSDWDFGDGSVHGSGTNVSHTYATAADYPWTLKVTAGSTLQTVQGVVTISSTLGPPITLTITDLGWALNISWPADPIPTALESTFDLTQPYGWQPDVVDTVSFDGVNNNVIIFASAAEQLFRIRRLP